MLPDAFQTRSMPSPTGPDTADKTARAEALMRTAATARMNFVGATVKQQREVLSTVLLNATLRDQEIVDYQLKSPFNLCKWTAHGALRDREVGSTGFEQPGVTSWRACV